jgi:hypothetical protein
MDIVRPGGETRIVCGEARYTLPLISYTSDPMRDHAIRSEHQMQVPIQRCQSWTWLAVWMNEVRQRIPNCGAVKMPNLSSAQKLEEMADQEP